MESYLKCLLENRKLLNQYYNKKDALVVEEQTMNVLVTLVSGLENVQFKLFSVRIRLFIYIIRIY